MRQRGRGAKWNKFKAFANRAWGKVVPHMKRAGRKAIPGLMGAMMSSGSNRSAKLTGVAKNFGRSVIRDSVTDLVK